MTTTPTLEADLEAVRALLEGFTVVCKGLHAPDPDALVAASQGWYIQNRQKQFCGTRCCECGRRRDDLPVIPDPRFDPLRRVINRSEGYPTPIIVDWQSTPPGALSGAVYQATIYIPEFVKIVGCLGKEDGDASAIRITRKALEEMR